MSQRLSSVVNSFSLKTSLPIGNYSGNNSATDKTSIIGSLSQLNVINISNLPVVISLFSNNAIDLFADVGPGN